MEELRIISDSKLCVRADEGDGRLIEGYGAVFDLPSKLIAEDGKVFVEHINRRALDDVLSDVNLNTVMCLDHTKSRILARSKAGTLNLTIDDYGLKYSFYAPNTTDGNDALENVKLGNYFESSFRYRVLPSNIRWWREDGMLHREILKISALVDVSIVVDGAFLGTDISIESDRSLQEFEKQEEIENEKVRSQELENYYTNINNNFYGVE